MDRISTLHDEILSHILSFLPTKQAVVTSLLSKRWLNLWKLVRDLFIDDSVFLYPEEGKAERNDIQQSFVGFMDTLLAMQGDSPVKKFSFKCISGIDPDSVNSWIRNVLDRGVSNLDIFVDFTGDDVQDSYQLPEEMFISQTLAELKLRSEFRVDWWHEARGALLPMLKSLDIDSDIISCGEIGMFFPSFPVLEELRMANMDWIESDVTVSSASLKKLTIYATGCEEFGNPKSVSFDTPSLISLCYCDLVAEDYPLVNMKKLTEATFKLILIDEQIERVRSPNHVVLEDEEDDVVQQFGNVVKLMNGIQHVEKLSLFPDTLEVLSLCCASMPVFKNLKFLGITSEEGRGWQAMPVILKNCPHLETIILQGLLHHVTDKCGDACPCIAQEDKGRSLKSCPVKLIEIQGFRATGEEMRIIKHFLEYFPCLKEMKIYVEEHDPTHLKNPEVSKCILEMIGLYNKLWSCDVQLLVSNYLEKKWITQGSM